MTQMETVLANEDEHVDVQDIVKPNVSLPTAKRGIAWAFVLIALFFFSAFVYAAVYGFYLAITQPELIQGGDAAALGTIVSNHLLSFSDSLLGLTIVQCLVLIPVLVLISNFKQQRFTETLALRGFSRDIFVKAVVLFTVYYFVSLIVNSQLVQEADEFISQINGAQSLGLTFAIVVLAPIVEELVFRGYLFKVFRSTRLGVSGTIVLTSGLFLLLHLGQYQWPLMVSLFLFACLLGYLREKSGSVYLPMLVHAINNFISAVVIVYLGLA